LFFLLIHRDYQWNSSGEIQRIVSMGCFIDRIVRMKFLNVSVLVRENDNLHIRLISSIGWIERCDKQTQTYEIYTPIDDLTNINLLISGAFDTPDEFEFMFKRVLV
jgi:hypothetical protein